MMPSWQHWALPPIVLSDSLYCQQSISGYILQLYCHRHLVFVEVKVKKYIYQESARGGWLVVYKELKKEILSFFFRNMPTERILFNVNMCRKKGGRWIRLERCVWKIYFFPARPSISSPACVP